MYAETNKKNQTGALTYYVHKIALMDPYINKKDGNNCALKRLQPD